jgi:hypothetical protein
VLRRGEVFATLAEVCRGIVFDDGRVAVVISPGGQPTGSAAFVVDTALTAIADVAAVALLLVLITPQTAFADEPSHHTVFAQERTGAPVAEVVIRDDDLVRQPIVKATYLLYDGYQKTVVIARGGSPLSAVDLANCHRADRPRSPPWPCSPVLHRSEVVYGNTGGHRLGSPDHYHAGLHATETATGSGDYLTVGEIDHGGTVRITYQDARGDVFTINFERAEAILIYRVVFQPGKGYSALILPLPRRHL